MQELTERQVKILNAIIKTYLDTGEPVGSRTISKMPELNASSATIRNEMSDLEEMGYILQPHTSAGRIPSDQGYRFYVDHILKEKDKELTEMQSFVIEHTERMERMLEKMATMLATNTNYATMISAPAATGSKIKFIQLSSVDEEQMLVTIVLDGNIVKNTMLSIEESISTEDMLKLNILLNTSLNGLSLQEINLAAITALKEQAGTHSHLVADILDTVAKALKADEDLEVYTSGAKNIFHYPELSTTEKASELISVLEDKRGLRSLLVDKLQNTGEDDSGIKIFIGSESEVKEMEDCSVVTASYEMGDGLKGKIGIVGPKRMDYEKVLQSLKKMSSELSEMYQAENDSEHTANDSGPPGDDGEEITA